MSTLNSAVLIIILGVKFKVLRERIAEDRYYNIDIKITVLAYVSFIAQQLLKTDTVLKITKSW